MHHAALHLCNLAKCRKDKLTRAEKSTTHTNVGLRRPSLLQPCSPAASSLFQRHLPKAFKFGRTTRNRIGRRRYLVFAAGIKLIQPGQALVHQVVDVFQGHRDESKQGMHNEKATKMAAAALHILLDPGGAAQATACISSFFNFKVAPSHRRAALVLAVDGGVGCGCDAGDDVGR